MSVNFMKGGRFRQLGWVALLLAIVLSLLFWKAWRPGYVHFSNDAPLGVITAEWIQLPSAMTGLWADLNWIGGAYPAPAPDISTTLRLFTSRVLFDKIYPVAALFVVGLCAWWCFAMHKFSPFVCLLAAIAATLNSDFVGTSAWGVCAQPIAFGMYFLAVGALTYISPKRRWWLVILAGFAVGIGIHQSYDIGALFSLFVGTYAVVHWLVSGENGFVARAATSVVRLGVVVVFAAIMAATTLIQVLSVATQVKGVAGAEQDAESKAARWSFATVYSIPKAEALGIAVPGLFGFRHDTPEGGAYWGRAGSDLAWDAYFASDKTGPPPRANFRAGAGSNYAGILVILLAAYGVAQSFRKEGGPFTNSQRKLIWFWCGALVVALLLMFGRFAPFYQFFYELPYVSTIRNPAKFMHIVEWTIIILFAYGAEALWRTGFGVPNVTAGLTTHWKNWWKKVAGFNRQWVFFMGLGVVAFALCWLAYASSRGTLEKVLLEFTTLATGGQVDPRDAAENAKATASYSIGQVGRTFLFLVPAVALVALAISGYFSGRRAALGTALFAGFMLLDLGPVNRYWIVPVNWKEKNESNSVVDFLRQRPYEHRVAIFSANQYVDLNRLPRELVQQVMMLGGLYGSEWTQHLFQYYNVQSLDIVQEPRMPADKAAFEAAMASASPIRRWELTNTRYLIGASPFLGFLNQQMDGGRNRFQNAFQFGFAAKPGKRGASGEEITTVISSTAPYAVFDFTGALPRAKLYTNWKTSTNDPAVVQTWLKSVQQLGLPREMSSALGAQTPQDLATLHELASSAFDPAQTVLLAEPIAAVPSTNQAPGEVKFESYHAKHIVLSAKASAPSVLLLNDKYDRYWKVTVNGKPANLLRANFVVRGVFLEQAGDYRVEFKYQPPTTGLYITLAAMFACLALVGFVIVAERKETKLEAGS